MMSGPSSTEQRRLIEMRMRGQTIPADQWDRAFGPPRTLDQRASDIRDLTGSTLTIDGIEYILTRKT